MLKKLFIKDYLNTNDIKVKKTAINNLNKPSMISITDV